MRISTRLTLTILVPVAMGVIVILLLAFSYQSTYALQQNGTKVREIRDGITNLNSYVFSYLLYHEDRPKQQFTAEYDSLTQLIAGVQIRNPDQQTLLENIRQSSTSMKDTFVQLESTYGSTNQAGNDPLAQAASTLLQGNLLIKSRDTDLNASLLKKSIDDQISATQIRNIVLIFIIVLLLIIPLTVFLIRTRKYVTSSLTQLRVGTEAVGAGNLNYRMNLPGRDELGDLARSFDGMTEQLQAITVSKVALQDEVEERKKAEQALQFYTKQLEVSNKELESFSYTVSHDLRAPLRSMDGFSKALLEDYAGNLDEQGKKWLENIRSSSQHMGRLIDDILALSRVVRTELKTEKVDLSELARSVAAKLEENEPARRIEFVIMPGIGGTCDHNLLNLVLQNLLGNAFKFTSGSPQASIEFGVNQQDGRKIYFVRDNGAGFDEKYSDKLFKPFQRLHSDKEYPGTGIGLVTVQRIIQRHGGEVWAKGEVNHGATFFFTLDEERNSR
jgi:signal transduction histidine kinase